MIAREFGSHSVLIPTCRVASVFFVVVVVVRTMAGLERKR